jgi:hypothetical protein
MLIVWLSSSIKEKKIKSGQSVKEHNIGHTMGLVVEDHQFYDGFRFKR